MPASQTKHNDSPKLVHEPLRDPLSVLLAPHRLGVNLLRKERPDGLVKPPVSIVVVRAMKSGAEPRRLGVGDARERAGCGRLDELCLPGHGADLETRVLGAQ